MQTIKLTYQPFPYKAISLEDIELCQRGMLDNNRELVIICDADKLSYEAEAVQHD
ncbi:MAG: hypothetical protein [Bacteriophage sp.]|nr:MAG: hypothetical protein [Bacteriophage sp.]